jgi:ribosomal-protein-alanine N-acetyltransferase
VLDRGGCPIGFVLSMLTEREGEILTLAVDPEHRRRGHGAQLLSAALADMAMTGIKRVVLEVAEDNAAARALYETHGFAVAGRRPRYYARRDDARMDAIVMIQVFAAGCGCDD